MRIDWYTLVLQTVNFAVLAWLLQHFLYRPVLRTVDARRAQIERELSDAHRTQVEAKEHLAALDAQRASIAAERAQVVAAAAAEAEEARVARHATAEREASALLADARKTIATERKQALDEAERYALDLADEFAHRLLSKFPDPLRMEAWFECIEHHLSALPDAERAALSRQLSPAAPLTVVTASALSPAEQASWRGRLDRALSGGPVAFRVDAALGAGAELHFPNAVLSFSLQSEVAAVRAELDPRSASHAARA